MATRNIVPRANGEGGIGTANKRWGSAHIQTLNADLAVLPNVNAYGLNPFWLLLQRNKSYAVGEVAYSSNLPSWAYLECVTAGETGTIEPSFSSFTIGSVVNDGSSVWVVNDVRDSVPVGDVVFRPFVRTGYLACNGQQVNRNTYPRLVKFATENNLWTSDQTNEPWKFGNGDGTSTMTMPNYQSRVIQGGTSAAKLEAGLPEIDAPFGSFFIYFGAVDLPITTNKWVNVGNGTVQKNCYAFTKPQETQTGGGPNSPGFYNSGVEFKASRGNPIYGNSTTVQPPAIVLVPQMKY